MFQRATLASRILLAVLAIVGLTMAAGLALYVSVTSRTADANAEERAADIAGAVAETPLAAQALTTAASRPALRDLAARIEHDTGASYVVVIGADGTRYSHPIAALVGQRIEEPVVALDGRVHTGADNGSLGRSANARVPIRNAAGTPIGEVSVGIRESDVSARVSQVVLPVIFYTGLVLAIGVAASLILARAIKRVTFGLEPAEIVALVQEREAMLHGIREGVIAFDPNGRVNVLNDEARRLLGLQAARLGQPLDELVPPGRLRDLLSGAVEGTDVVAVTGDNLLVLNRRPVVVAGRNAGSVVTIRDRTEVEALLRQLDSVESLTTALRAQEHEYSNRLHVMSVLLGLGEIEEATAYADEVSVRSLAADVVRARIAPPVVAALLIAKITVATERDVEVVLTPDSALPASRLDHTPLVTVLGNLVDNAVDAVADGTGSGHPRGRVTVELHGDGHEFHLVVTDTGPGIPADLLDQVFVDGYSTKEPRAGGMRRGVGLALVQRLVRRAGGTITASSPAGARFDVRLPVRRQVEEVVS
ncbi:two-component system CitB family sensor kinase [Kribbella aluminosa]|uniref:histidine kinase n=1 Tax=Kribbella aluminosa TaxID=416017 RepID=A0ABS4UCT0_9ACTN|nr:sensor histidine kinase [Kribbella aluminosa]MBP2349435.1 two-component system CitB family sensor kinase [Kribbella aluminosa]